uniref:PSI domain-containing protein n=1 Tax=Parastrongyloides trichosuri TaxID=131310 RepID=A0A0N4ZU06_PARTI
MYQKFIIFLILLIISCQLSTQYGVAEDINSGISTIDEENYGFNVQKQINCSIPKGEEINCHNCLNIDKSCLWCESKKSCQKYDGLYQSCSYDDSRILHCNLPYKAVLIFFIVLACVVFVICIIVFCFVCSKMDQCAKWNRNRIYMKDNLKLKIQNASVFKEQEQRKMARKARIDELRVKYGIQLSSPSFTRMNSFREKKDESNI